jgi:predicted metal-binding membrane protein
MRSGDVTRSAAGVTHVLHIHVANNVRVAFVTIVASAWAIAILSALGGAAAALHHHALIEGGPPFWIAIPLFLGAWLVMVAAMMLPGSLPAIDELACQPASTLRPVRTLAAFLVAYGVIWSGFGLLAYLGDVALHHLADATPWLAANPWLIAASVFAIAGVYELSPAKRRWLEVCRQPGLHVIAGETGRRVGLEHGLACLGSSWALMLLMFGAGVASLPWMISLTAVMAYQAVGRRGERTVALVGATLLIAAFLLFTDPTEMPAWLLV